MDVASLCKLDRIWCKNATLTFNAAADGWNNYCSCSLGGEWKRKVESDAWAYNWATLPPKELRLSCSIYLESKCDSTGSEDTVPDRRPVGGHGVTPCVIHCAAANLSIELISTYAMLEFICVGIFYYMYIATHLHPHCAVNTPDSAIVSTKGVALQGITTQKVSQTQRLG